VYSVCYSTLFGIQLLVWLSSIVVFCMLKYYLDPIKLPGKDASPMRVESNPILWRKRKREERIAKF